MLQVINKTIVIVLAKIREGAEDEKMDRDKLLKSSSGGELLIQNSIESHPR